MNTRYDDHFKKCALCGEKFFVPDYGLYVYRRGEKFFCSWTCLRKFDAKQKTREEKQSERYVPVKKCYDCQFNIVEGGMRICYIGKSKKVFPMKAACSRFVKRRDSNAGS